GATLALVNLVYIPFAESVPPAWRKSASWSLVVGSFLMPLGFFLGGLVHFEGDPGYGIFLAPLAAVCILLTIGLQVVAAWRDA
ncbi:MAG: hypothetical protein KDD89_15825, partial [Anaerolineales bacterium]|nr:hypothetical protein [Anaerolineales bacterium]